MTDDGVMLLHTTGCSDEPSVTNPWITRYIFPGGHLPSLSDIVKAVERSGLVVTDIEVLRLHYAETLRAWRSAFMTTPTRLWLVLALAEAGERPAARSRSFVMASGPIALGCI
ncbi:class I SAM-dependent methyltransferase [Caulobacter sp. LARHSG274]